MALGERVPSVAELVGPALEGFHSGRGPSITYWMRSVVWHLERC
jgi:hypothetical protein